MKSSSKNRITFLILLCILGLGIQNNQAQKKEKE